VPPEAAQRWWRHRPQPLGPAPPLLPLPPLQAGKQLLSDCGMSHVQGDWCQQTVVMEAS
jgi:hypothetical protein